jgi:hypothetical protein
MTDEDNTSAPAETVDARDDHGGFTVDEAASRIAATLGDEPETAPATAAKADAVEGEKDPKAEDPDDWDTPDQQAAEGQSEAEEPKGEEGEQPSDQGRFVGDTAKVRLSDGRVVTVAELRSGALMQSDYTRKTQELAEHRRLVEARQAEFEQQAQELTSQRELAALILSQNIPAEPDVSMLREDPIGYMEAKQAREVRLAQLQQLWTGVQQEQASKAQKFTAAAQQHVAREAENLVKALPELKNPVKRDKWLAELKSTAEAYGFAATDLDNAKDHRLLLMATDAMRYRRMNANRQQSVEKAKGKPPAVIEPGRRPSPQANARKEVDDLRKRARHTGRPEDAAKVIERFL